MSATGPPPSACALCAGAGGVIAWQGVSLRVVLPDEPDYPGFVRVVWQRHVAEMTDLSATERTQLMDAVWAVERVVRDTLKPDKVNVASLGNLVPHLHWHVIARWRDDRHFPGSVWSQPRSPGEDAAAAARIGQVAARRDALLAALGRTFG